MGSSRMLLWPTVFFCALSALNALKLCEVERVINQLKQQAARNRKSTSMMKSSLQQLQLKYATQLDAMQWQMYHVGASAACSGVTNYQKLQRGGGPAQAHNGWVYVHRGKQTCAQVCATNKMKCVQGVRVQGNYGAITNPKKVSGHYYSLGCKWTNPDYTSENFVTGKYGEGALKRDNQHVHYCCCTVMQAKNWKIVDKVLKKTI